MAIISCYECGTGISDKAKKCPKCGAPCRKEKINSVKRQSEGPNKVAFVGFAAGIILLMIAGFSDSWVVSESSGGSTEGMEIQWGLTHVAVDCSNLEEDDERLRVCKVVADSFTSGKSFYEYIEDNGLENCEWASGGSTWCNAYADSLPEKSTTWTSEHCSNTEFYEPGGQGDRECQELKLAGYVSFFFGLAPVFTGIFVITTLVFQSRNATPRGEAVANKIAVISTLCAYLAFALWLILIPDLSKESASEYGFAFYLAIVSLIFLTLSSIFILYWQYMTEFEQ